MTVIKMETDLTAELERLYMSTAQKLSGSIFRLSTSLTRFNNLLSDEANRCLQIIGELITGLSDDGRNILWRRKWMQKK